MTAAPDTAAFFARLRADTARLLKLDPDALSPAQSARVSRAAVLRLSLDRMESTALAGGEVDLKNFISASAELERLLGGDPNQASSIHASGESRERLRRLIETTVLAAAVDDPGEAERIAERQRREEMAAVIAAGGNVEAAAPTPVASPPANVVPFEPKPPAHYLADHQHAREPWRGYRDGGTFNVPSWPLPK